MGSIRRKLIIVAVAAALALGATAPQAGLMPPNVSVVEGTISSFDAASGRLVMAGRTLHLSAQTMIHRRMGERFEAASRTQLYPGQEARALIRLREGRYVVRSLELIAKKPNPAK